ncbi:MAG: ParB/RepB/Spo0J family partition protein [Candidatus Paceibacterota bacterium]
MLGKGLESLIPKKDNNQELGTSKQELGNGENFFSPKPESSTTQPQEAAGSGRKPSDADAIFYIEVEKITPNPHQPRRDFNEESLKELAASIREFGILQPIIVSKIEKEVETGTRVEYQLIAGERRFLAAKMLGLEQVPAIIKNISQKSEQLEMAVIENLQRTDLNPIETARAYAKLQDEFGLTQREIATRLGKSREIIANTLRLLNLPSEIQDALTQNKINESQARLLLSVSEPSEQKNLFDNLLANNLSVRELRARIRKPQSTNQPINQLTNVPDAEIQYLQEQLTELLNAQVKIQKAGQGGKVVITFYSPEEIRGIIDKLTS